MDGFLTNLHGLAGQAYTNWVMGGWCMPAMAGNAFVMFALGIHVWLKLHSKKFRSVPEETWRIWLEYPGERSGPVGDVLDYVTGGGNAEETSNLFNEVRVKEIAPFERDLRVMGVCATAAPLIGLLGTVTGILTLFGALAHGSGGEKTMKLIAEGVSEALIATQTGLVVALPGLIFHNMLTRQYERYKAFLMHLETVYLQKVHKSAARMRMNHVQREKPNGKV